jgi:hypothetical protein
VTTTNSFGVKTNGWLWGAYDSALRWGENTVTGVVDGGTAGEQLKAEFNEDSGPNECDLSTGDSGGAVFVLEGATWQLAGINYSVDGYFNYTDTDAGKFDAAIYDQGGLYEGDGTNWVWMPDLPHHQPGAFYATRVSSQTAWINGILAQPIPGTERVVLQAAEVVMGLYADDSSAVVEESTRTVTLPQPGRARFYRLRACAPLQITSIELAGSSLILRYE